MLNKDFVLHLVKSRILDEVIMLVTVLKKVRVCSFTKSIEEVSKEPLVHVLCHLIENKPVTQGAVFHIVFYMSVILILLEISSDLPSDEAIPEVNG